MYTYIEFNKINKMLYQKQNIIIFDIALKFVLKESKHTSGSKAELSE